VTVKLNFQISCAYVQMSTQNPLNIFTITLSFPSQQEYKHEDPSDLQYTDSTKLPPFIRFQPVHSDHPVMTVRERERARETGNALSTESADIVNCMNEECDIPSFDWWRLVQGVDRQHVQKMQKTIPNRSCSHSHLKPELWGRLSCSTCILSKAPGHHCAITYFQGVLSALVHHCQIHWSSISS